MPAPVALSRRMGGHAWVEPVTRVPAGLPVLLLVDPYINHLEPEIGEAAISVLRHLGYAPEVHFMDCSLRLLVSEGFLDEAKKGLRRLRDDLILRGKVPLIGLEPAELLLLRDEAPALLGDAWPVDLTARCFLLDEFLVHEHAAGRLQSQTLPASGRLVNVHPHCHERAAGSASAMVKALTNVFGLRTTIISTGCCGMGGSFGYRYSEMSKKIFHNNVRLPAKTGEPSPLLVSGTSCRHQFRDLSEIRPLHLAQFLLDQFDNQQDQACQRH